MPQTDPTTLRLDDPDHPYTKLRAAILEALGRPSDEEPDTEDHDLIKAVQRLATPHHYRVDGRVLAGVPVVAVSRMGADYSHRLFESMSAKNARDLGVQLIAAADRAEREAR